MENDEKLKELEKRRKEWEEGTLKKGLERFRIAESPQKLYTPLDIRDHDYLQKVGFPGEYPFTAGIYPVSRAPRRGGDGAAAAEARRAGGYSGYGTSADTRDFYRAMQERGWAGGPNLAFDLPTQCGYDSDNPVARGEVGRVGADRAAGS